MVKILAEAPHICQDTVYSLASANGVAGFIYKNAEEFNLFSEKINLALQSAYKQTALKNMLMLKETLAVSKLLSDNEIPVVPLKGSSASDLIFNDFGVYPSGDIDILVPFTKLGKAKDILCRYADYSPVQGIEEQDLISSHYHLNLKKKYILLEIHWTLTKRYFSIPHDFWWQGAEPFEWNTVPVFKLSIENYILYNVFRLYDHCFYPLRFFSLLAGIITHHYADINWEKLLDSANRYKMYTLVVFTLKLMNDILQTRIPETMIQKKIMGYLFLKSLVLSGFFSGIQKQHGRMLFYTLLLVKPETLAGILLKRLFPSKGELRLRYNLPGNSKKIYLYYILNPFLLLFKKQENIHNA
ncbi:MAG: nucleotidyltransferase family protein [Proteobacteria bacterium]|nr:nucleotidyltransferase family protein [Pseudomonadota bacterium]MBU1388044.1 nucleotidyltransferase family protein [Pseudomonadota bacterium]MBU1542107.1 nucleotidyltransferase family protein [Pseudomonadota bacterium]MBU2482371.1 nucleotidyltransferase family protein [Pseudomonadota bacterium]